MASQFLGEPALVQPLIAPHQFVHSPGAKAQSGAQVAKAGLAEIHHVTGHLRWLARKIDGGVQNRQLVSRVAHQVPLQSQASQDPECSERKQPVDPS